VSGLTSEAACMLACANPRACVGGCGCGFVCAANCRVSLPGSKALNSTCVAPPTNKANSLAYLYQVT